MLFVCSNGREVGEKVIKEEQYKKRKKTNKKNHIYNLSLFGPLGGTPIYYIGIWYVPPAGMAEPGGLGGFSLPPHFFEKLKTY